MSTATPLKCSHCDRPIGGVQTWIGGFAFHQECAHGPGADMTLRPQVAATWPRPLTEDRVREIVREEMERFELVDRRDPR